MVSNTDIITHVLTISPQEGREGKEEAHHPIILQLQNEVVTLLIESEQRWSNSVFNQLVETGIVSPVICNNEFWTMRLELRRHEAFTMPSFQ